MAFTGKGSFSFLQDRINYVRINPNLELRIQRVDGNVARVFLVDQESVEQPIPAYVQMTTLAGVPVGRLGNNFLIVWAESYLVTVNGVLFLRLKHERQQSLTAAAGTASGLV